MNERIAASFARLKAHEKKALIPFITAGDPEPSQTVPIMHALVEAGADIIELGVPFSDPMADGPTIQRASERALKNSVGLHSVLEMVEVFRRDNSDTPVVLMGYANPVEAMGVEAFVEAAANVGVDGVLIVDYPPEEAEAFAAAMREQRLDVICLLAPTSNAERVARTAALASGYVYYVSLTGVTGARHLNVDEVARHLPEIRAVVKVPVGVGFGIRDAETARKIAEHADAVVVGSRVIECIEQAPRARLCEHIRALIAELRRGLDAA